MAHPISLIRALVATVASYQNLAVEMTTELRLRSEALEGLSEAIDGAANESDCVKDIQAECDLQLKSARERTDAKVGQLNALRQQAKLVAESISDEMPFDVTASFEIIDPVSGTPDLPKFDLPTTGIPALDGTEPEHEGQEYQTSADRTERELVAENGGAGFGS